MMDTWDPCSVDDINNDVNSLYVEIIEKNRIRMHDLWPKVGEETDSKPACVMSTVMFTEKVRNSTNQSQF